MKRIICLLLCLIVFCNFSACKKQENTENTNFITEYANKGKIPECDYTLGDDPEKIKSDFLKASQEDEDNYYFFDEEIDYSVIDNGVNKIFYKTEYLWNYTVFIRR